MHFSIEELKNILAILNIAPINGSQALTIVLLQQKIQKLLESEDKKDKSSGKS